MKNFYSYTTNMMFEFVDNLPSNDNVDYNNAKEWACATENAIKEYLQKMSKYNLYFKLFDENMSDGAIPFEIIGTIKNILKWNEEEWRGDEDEIKESAKKL